MAQKKRTPKRKASPKKKRSNTQDGEPLELTEAMRKALAGLPKPARAVLDRVGAFKRKYPKLYEIITRDIDSPDYRRFERDLELKQEESRGRS